MTKKLILWGLVLVLSAAAAGYLVLINPGNPLTRAFQRKIADVDSRIVTGPYPVEADFATLKQADVGLIVSLLDPAIPYEKTLLERERRLAAAHGMRLRNFPMASILGRKFGGYYATSAADAADAIANTSDKVYLHCYLGRHRIQVVRDLLSAKGVQAARYVVRESERDTARRLLDAADAAYAGKRYEEALAQLAMIKPEELSLPARLLRAWSSYHLGRNAEAAECFAQLRADTPALIAPFIGGGYCALRAGDAPGAIALLQTAVERAPRNADAVGGLGLAHARAGHRDDAIRCLKAALELTPENAEFSGVLAELQKGS